MRWPSGRCVNADMGGTPLSLTSSGARRVLVAAYSGQLAERHSGAEIAAMKLVSWNVNGVRAALKNGLLDFMAKADADVICFQEAKAVPGDVQHIAWPLGYEVFWNPAVKKGYSGTVTFTRVKPKSIALGINLPAHDGEGRVMTTEFTTFTC